MTAENHQPPAPVRRTHRLEIEVTIIDYPGAIYSSDALADDLREDVFRSIMDTVPRDIVTMTVSPAEEPPAPDAPAPGHEFTGTVKRADGVIITATLAVPDTHPMAQPGPHRVWHGAGQSNQNFLELGELAMMIAQRGYSLIESNERSRERWGKQDYWADLLNIEPPVAELEAGK